MTVEATISDKETVKATCEADGHKIYEASATFQEVVYTDSKTQTLPKTGHLEDTSSWKYNETSHWHNCLNCGENYKFSFDAHSFSDWSIVLEPTHYSKGSKERYCTVCSYTEPEELPMTAYTYSEVKALHDKFATFDSKSYYLSHIGTELAYAIEHINSDDKIVHQNELNEWSTAVNTANTYFNTNYSVVINAEGMDTYENTVTSEEFHDGYGTVLKVNSSSDLAAECWSWGTNRKIEFASDIQTLVFAVYNQSPMELMITNDLCNKFYQPVTNGTWKAASNTIICLTNDWTTFEINVADLADFDSLRIALYLSPSPFIGYGIPSITDIDAKGSAYITEVVGIKSAYYQAQAQEVSQKISALSSLNKDSLTIWNGGQIFEARSEYNALPASAQSFVTNLSLLEEYETAYALVGTAYNYKWQDGLVSTGTKFDSVAGYDATYGLYTEINNINDTSGWTPTFSPLGSVSISSDAKVAFYNPQDGNVTLVVLGNDWSGTTYPVVTPGWNVLDISASVFTGGIVSGVSIGLANSTATSGFKLTPIYSSK